MARNHDETVKAQHKDPNVDTVFYSSDKKTAMEYHGQFKKMRPGQIVCAFNPFGNWGQFFRVHVKCHDEARKTDFMQLIPVSLEKNGFEVVPRCSYPGMSGSPIIDANGEVVGVYGLTKVTKFQDAESGEHISEVVFSGMHSQESDYTEYFSKAVHTLLTADSEVWRQHNYAYLVAPTGTGKTTRFTQHLMIQLGKEEVSAQILLLQPNVTAVQNTFKFLSQQMVGLDSAGNKYKISFYVGEQNTESTDSWGSGSIELHLMTYGKFRASFRPKYNFIIEDEIHSAMTDANVATVDILLETHPNKKYTLVKMTADTSLEWPTGFDLTGGAMLQNTLHDIQNKEMGVSSDTQTNLVFPRSVFTSSDHDNLSIPYSDIPDGVVLVFLPSKSECERAASWFNTIEQMQGRKAHAVYSGCSTNINTAIKENDWCFCTDIVQQSVTISNTSMVVDFCKEWKPAVIASYTDTKITYQCELLRRSINKSAQQQRRGRCGRQRQGTYYTPPGATVINSSESNMYIAPEVVLMLSSKEFDFNRLASYSNIGLGSQVKHYAWLAPDSLGTSSFARDTIAPLLFGGSIRNSYKEKLMRLLNVSGDLVYNYLRMWVTKHELDLAEQGRLLRTANQSTTTAFYSNMAEFWARADRDIELVDEIKLYFSLKSFTEDALIDSESHSDAFEYLQTRASTRLTIEEASMTENSSAIFGAVVSQIALVAGASAMIHFSFDQFSSRVVTHMCYMHKKEVAQNAKYFAIEFAKVNKDPSKKFKFVKDWQSWKNTFQHVWNQFVNKFVKLFPWLKQTRGMTQCSSGAALDVLLQMKQLCLHYYNMMVTSNSWLACANLESIFGGTIVGALFTKLEKYLSKPVAFAILGVLAGLVHFYCGWQQVVTAGVCATISYFIKEWVSDKPNDFVAKLAGKQDNNSYLRFLTAGAMGVGLSVGLNMLTATKVSTVGMQIVGNLSPVAFTANGGQFGYSCILVKNLYHLCIKSNSIGEGFTLALSALTSAYSLNWLGLITTGVALAGLIGLRTLYCAGVARYAHGLSKTAPGENEYNKLEGRFDKVAMVVLSSVSVLANPMSVVSVIMCALYDMHHKKGEKVSQIFFEAFNRYAGVNFFLPLIEKTIHFMSAAPYTTNGVSDITGLCSNLLTIISSAAYLCTTATLGSFSGCEAGWFADAFSKVTSWIKFVCSKIMDFVKGCVETVGGWLGLGVKKALLGKDKNEVGNVNQEPGISVVLYNPNVAKDMIKLYDQSKGLSIWETAFYFNMLPGSYTEYGDVTRNQHFANVLQSYNNHCTTLLEFEVDLHLDTFCVPTDTIADTVNKYMGVGEMIDGKLVVRHSKRVVGFSLDATVSYSTAFNQNRLLTVLEVTGCKVTIVVVLYGIRTGEKTKFYLIGFGVQKTEMDIVLRIMGDFCLSFKRTSTKQLDEVPQLLSSELLLAGIKKQSDILRLRHFGSNAVIKWLTNHRVETKAAGNPLLCGLEELKPEGVNQEWWYYYGLTVAKHYYSGTSIPETAKMDYYVDQDTAVPLGLPTTWYDLPIEVDIYGWQAVTGKQDPSVSAIRVTTKDGVSYEVSLGKGVDVALHEFLVCSFKLNIGVFFKTSRYLKISPYGLQCLCKLKYDYDDKQLFYVVCDDCRSQEKYLKIENCELPIGREDKYLSDVDLRDSIIKVNEVIAKGNENSQVLAVQASVTQQFQRAVGAARNWFGSSSSAEKYTECSAGWWHSCTTLYRELFRDGSDERNFYTDTIDNINRKALAEREIEEPDEPEIVELDRRPIGTNCDFPSSLLGFGQPVIREAVGWAWHKNIPCVWTDPDDVMKMYNTLEKQGRELTKAQWQKIAHLDRFELPKRVYDVGEEFHIHASRAYFKMQLLVEADPGFFDNAMVILDPACGYGGFEQYLGNHYYNRQKFIFASSLNVPYHRIPDTTKMQVVGSNVRVVNLYSHSHEDRNDIRFSSCRDRLRGQLVEVTGLERQVDLIIFDVGEFMNSNFKQCQFWQTATEKHDSLIEGLEKLCSVLKDGGKLLMKFTGYFQGGAAVLHTVLRHFRHFKAHKVATQGYFSTEFYIYCSGYTPNRIANLLEVTNLYHWIGVHIYQGLKRAQTLLVRSRDYVSHIRSDWLYPRGSTVMYKPVPSGDKPCGYSIVINGKYWQINDNFLPNWDYRLNAFFKHINRGKQYKFFKVAAKESTNLHILGQFKVALKEPRIKDTSNALIGEMVNKVYGIDSATSTYGHTQSTRPFREASFKKRLDVDPGEMSLMAATELADIMPLMVSEAGKKHLGNCQFLGKQRVLELMNQQGATGIFSPQNTLRQFMEANPNWYEICLEYCVEKWRIGAGSHCYMSIMHKNEPKARKDATDGKLNYRPGSISRKELLENSQMPHRYIQFADEISRISHYIVLGDLIDRANQQKIYKGTINGTPPYLQGNVLRACWDLHLPEHEKVIGNGVNQHVNIVVENDHSEYEQNGRPAACILDFSGYDGTITSMERFLEYQFLKQFYPPELHETLKHMLEELCYAICLDHEGNVWLRAGQRGSGELITSLGNTLLAGANIYRAVSKILNKPPEYVLETVAKVHYQVGKKHKTLEVTRVPQFADGDDTVIISDETTCRVLRDHLPEVVGEANKILRSGQQSGARLVTKFSDVEFCSHTYEPIVFGPGASALSMREEDTIALAKQGKYKLRYMPCKPTADILSRFRLTLKSNTQTWKWDDGTKDGCVDVTRSKVLSYLLLYPHIRQVRYSCLSMLLMIGDGPASMTKFLARYRDDLAGADFSTSMRALNSVHGVSSLDDVGLRQYSVEYRYLRSLRCNASLGGYDISAKSNILLRELCKFVIRKGFRDFTPLYFDHKYTRQFGLAMFDITHNEEIVTRLGDTLTPDLTSFWRNYMSAYKLK